MCFHTIVFSGYHFGDQRSASGLCRSIKRLENIVANLVCFTVQFCTRWEQFSEEVVGLGSVHMCSFAYQHISCSGGGRSRECGCQYWCI